LAYSDLRLGLLLRSKRRRSVLLPVSGVSYRYLLRLLTYRAYCTCGEISTPKHHQKSPKKFLARKQGPASHTRRAPSVNLRASTSLALNMSLRTRYQVSKEGCAAENSGQVSNWGHFRLKVSPVGYLLHQSVKGYCDVVQTTIYYYMPCEPWPYSVAPIGR
jgi:hypothetical protein